MTEAAHRPTARLALRPVVVVLASTFPRWRQDPEIPDFVLRLSAALAGHFSVEVLTPHLPGAPARDEIDGVRITRVRYAPAALEQVAGPGGMMPRLRAAPWRALLLPAMLLTLGLALWRRLRRGPVALVHAHWIVPQGVVAAAALALSRRPPPLVVTAHGSDVFALRGAWARNLRRRVAARSAALTAPSQALRDALRAESPEGAPVHVLPMGADLRETFIPARASSSAVRVAFAGRLLKQKGLHVLLEALAIARRRCPSLTLDVAGAGPEAGTLATQARALGLADAVRFRGPLSHPQLARLFQESGIVAFPSLFGTTQEGFGLVPIEAMGCGCAVIASDIPSMRELIDHGRTGLRVEAGDAGLWAEALVRLAGDAELRERLGMAGRRHVEERYDWTRVGEAYADLLRRSVPGLNAPGPVV